MPHAFYLAGPAAIFVQIILCVHVYKTGRPYWWIWIIMMSSLLGCLAYTLIEVLPDARRGSIRLPNTSWMVPRSVRLKRARELLEESDTIDVRLGLAEELFDAGEGEEAAAVASEAVSGVFKDDAPVIAEVAWYNIEAGKVDEADRLIAKANFRGDKFVGYRLEILKARILLARGNYETAWEQFERLKDRNYGEEPRYYAAKCLHALGQKQEALKVLDAIKTKYRKSNRMWRRSEKRWYQRSKEFAAELVKANG